MIVGRCINGVQTYPNQQMHHNGCTSGDELVGYDWFY